MTTALSRPPLVRSSDRVIAGVCAGLAKHLGWPVRMVRIGMVVAALAGGAGLAFYAWLWIMVPTADESARRNARRPASPIAPAVSGRSGGRAGRYRRGPVCLRRAGGPRRRAAAGPAGRQGPLSRRPAGRGYPGVRACVTARRSCSAPGCCWLPGS